MGAATALGIWILASQTMTEPLPRADLSVLRANQVPVDGAALVQWLQPRLPRAGDEAILAELIRQLGDSQFAVRDRATGQLKAAGPKAIPVVKAGLAHRSPEVRRRCEQALAAVSQELAIWPEIVSRLREERRPGSIATLLSMAPLADASTEEAIVIALVTLGGQGGRLDPVILESLRQTDPTQRAVGAQVVSRSRVPEAPATLANLLLDKEPVVRLHAATGLLARENRDAARVLLPLLEVPAVAARAETVLQGLAGPQSPRVAFDAPPADKRKAWEQFVSSSSSKLDYSVVREMQTSNGLVLQARQVAERFIAHWQRNSGKGLLQVSSAPFWSAGSRYETVQDMERAWGGMGGGNVGAYHYRFHRLLLPAQALRFCQGGEEEKVIRALRAHDHRVMIYSPTPASWGLMLIRRTGSRVTVAGLSTDRSGEPPR